MRLARERVASGSRVVETPAGAIEYASEGDGPPVLVVHGAGGGFDQGMQLSRPLVDAGFRVVAPSRFGYLRTPLPEDASAVVQADAHAALLDALSIERTAVVGVSAGAPSAMQLALRHPGRVEALVLLVPAAYPARIARTARGGMPERLSKTTGFVLDAALRSDFLFWLVCRAARRATSRAILATPPEVLAAASAEERARAASVVSNLLPISRRRLGLVNDAAVTRGTSSSASRCPLSSSASRTTSSARGRAPGTPPGTFPAPASWGSRAEDISGSATTGSLRPRSSVSSAARADRPLRAGDTIAENRAPGTT
jgi:pimeloyl-ACP methyl ester carboxylesterase